ncbi:SPRY domain-containing protein [Paenibacillus sp. NPDC058174]|uniref:SPRY domain-containing protein n=1 Tax=Paenibacillus sp. NPDC058174 TaxID=3346366 RepID=UPI0036DC3923
MPLVTWDTVNKGTAVALSNNNLTYSTSGVANSFARASLGRSTGKFYWEITCNTQSSLLMGVANNSALLAANNYSTNNIRYYFNVNGNKYPTTSAYGAPVLAGSTVSVLIDLDIGKIEFWNNGISQGVAYTDLKSMGTLYPAIERGSSSGSDICTINFGASPFVYKIPLGYFSYDGSQYGAQSRIIFTTKENELYSLIYSSYKNNAVPIMTSNKMPSGSVNASSFLSGYEPWKAFDGLQTSAWASTTASQGWLSYDFDKNIFIGKYSITGHTNPNESPKMWTFEGLNDNSIWDVIDAKSNIIFTSGEKKEYVINSSKKYKSYRLNVTATPNGRVAIKLLELYEGLFRFIKLDTKDLTENTFLDWGLQNNVALLPGEYMNNKLYVSSQSNVLDSGIVFQHQINVNETPIKKIVIN